MHGATRKHLSIFWVAALWATGTPAQEAHDHGQIHGALQSANGPGSSALAIYNQDDLYFIHHMIVHHQQALEMNELLDGRTRRPELVRFASVLANSQHAEIQSMQVMLNVAASRGLVVPHHDMSGDPPMAGMLSSADMGVLAKARGAAFEQLWLKGMIFHHEGALGMAKALELRRSLERRQPDDLAVMLDDTLIEQRAEIAMMRDWLKSWDMATNRDERIPVVDVSSPAPETTLAMGRSQTLLGVAVDDTRVAAVRVAIHDLVQDEWLRKNGSWGKREFHQADLIQSGPASVAWRFAFTPPSDGRFSVVVQVEDGAGKDAYIKEPMVFEVHSG